MRRNILTPQEKPVHNVRNAIPASDKALVRSAIPGCEATLFLPPPVSAHDLIHSRRAAPARRRARILCEPPNV